MALKQDGVYFIQFVLNKVIDWGRFFCFPKRGQGFKTSAADLYPKLDRVP